MKKNWKHNQPWECLACRDGSTAAKHWQREMFWAHGRYIRLVRRDDTSPTGFNAHTHGLLDSLGHPDLQIVLRLGRQAAAWIFNTLVNRIKRGERFESGDQCYLNQDGPKVPMLFLDALESDRPVLRVILGDEDGNVAVHRKSGRKKR